MRPFFYIIVTPMLIAWRLAILPLHLAFLVCWVLEGIVKRIGEAMKSVHGALFWAIPPPWIVDVERLIQKANVRERDEMLANLKKDREHP